jgi:PAS domain S-box-containing protein
MQTQSAVIARSEFTLRILAEIDDAVIVTDSEQHILYWNGQAEGFYGLRAEDALGRRLDACCPLLWEAAQPLLIQPMARDEKRRCEVVLHRQAGDVIFIECTVSLLNNNPGAQTFLWIQRDITERKKLQAEVQLCHDLLRKNEPQVSMPQPLEEQAPGSSNVVLWAEDDDNDAILMIRAWAKAGVDEKLIRVQDGIEVMKYLRGEGMYSDRRQFPLPALLLLDIKMPQVSGLEVIHWLQTQPRFKDLPVVLLTSSGASSDVHEAARLGVKGYLVKPIAVTEWIVKVKTLTSQCK